MSKHPADQDNGGFPGHFQQGQDDPPIDQDPQARAAHGVPGSASSENQLEAMAAGETTIIGPSTRAELDRRLRARAAPEPVADDHKPERTLPLPVASKQAGKASSTRRATAIGVPPPEVPSVRGSVEEQPPPGDERREVTRRPRIPTSRMNAPLDPSADPPEPEAAGMSRRPGATPRAGIPVEEKQSAPADGPTAVRRRPNTVTGQALKGERPKSLGEEERFQIERHLGDGRDSTAYLALDRRERNRRCVVKTYRGKAREMMDDLLGSLEETQYEGLVPGCIVHDMVVRVLGCLRDEEHGPLLVLEWVDGRSLEHIIKERKRPMSAKAAARLYGQVAVLMAEAHEQGGLVGDVQPRQLFLRAEKDLAKIDASPSLFSHAPDLFAAWLQRRGADDLAPELRSKEPVPSVASDIFALGAAVGRAVTGDGRAGVLRSKGGLPRDLRAFLDRCLKPEPSQRFGTAREAAAALMRCAKPSTMPTKIGIVVACLAAGTAASVAFWPSQQPAGVFNVSLETCPPISTIDESQGPLATIRTYRMILKENSSCAEVQAKLDAALAAPQVKALQAEYRKRLMDAPDNVADVDEATRRKLHESVEALRAIDPRDSLAGYWFKQLGADSE